MVAKTIATSERQLSADDATLQIINDASDDITNIFKRRKIPLSLAINVLAATTVKAVWSMERQGADAEEVLAAVLALIRRNLVEYRRSQLDG